MRAPMIASDAPVLVRTCELYRMGWDSTNGMEMLFPVNRLHTAGTGFPITGAFDA
jgi:hypothetical protein